MPLVPLTRTEATWPPPPSRVIDLVMVTAPKPPGSNASISPPWAVLEMAPAQVLHGAVRLQGLASSPTPDTQVRDAWALNIVGANKTIAKLPNRLILRISLFLLYIQFLELSQVCQMGENEFHPRANAGLSCV